jgi:arylsulfatase
VEHERTAAAPVTLDFGAVQYVIPSHFGFCLGVKNAIERAYETLAENPGRRVFMLSELIHNPFVNEDLLRRGLRYLQTDKGVAYTTTGRAATGAAGEELLWDSLTPEQKRFQATKMAIHAAMVHRMDREIGRVLDQIRAMKALDNTIVLFLSDNGADSTILVRGDGHDPAADPGSAASYLCLGPGWASASNSPFRRHKIWVHEGGISTPMIVHWPAAIRARGEFRRTPAHVIDVLPTLLELAGTTALPSGGPPRPGRSLAAAFTSDVPIARDHLYFHHEGNRALRVGDWKLVSFQENKDAWELYDLGTDRAEMNDLAARHPDRVKEMEARWKALTEEFARQAGP